MRSAGRESARVPWTIEELQTRVEIEFDAQPMGPREMAGLADALHPYFEDERFTSIVIRGLEDQKFAPPQHVVKSLQEWAERTHTQLELRTRLGHPERLLERRRTPLDGSS
jgi:hypothetical protein